MTPIPKPPRRSAKPPKPIKRGKRPAKARKTSRGKLKAQCDRAFSLWIRARDRWTCQGCGVQFREDGPLPAHAFQCAHGFSRRYHSTRWDPANAWCLCRSCHVRYTHDPLGWDQWMRERLGLEVYEFLRTDALIPCPKLDYARILQNITEGVGPYKLEAL